MSRSECTGVIIWIQMPCRAVEDGERAWLRETLAERWGGDEALGRGRAWRPAELPALLAVAEDGETLGIATYSVEGEEAELVTLDALVPGRGAGRALIDAVAHAARERKATIPLISADGIPLHDEIDLVLELRDHAPR